MNYFINELLFEFVWWLIQLCILILEHLSSPKYWIGLISGIIITLITIYFI